MRLAMVAMPTSPADRATPAVAAGGAAAAAASLEGIPASLIRTQGTARVGRAARRNPRAFPRATHAKKKRAPDGVRGPKEDDERLLSEPVQGIDDSGSGKFA